MQRVKSTDATNLAHLVHGGMIAVMVQKLEGFCFENIRKLQELKRCFSRGDKDVLAL